MSIITNKKFKIASIVVFVLLSVLLARLLKGDPPSGINCTGTVTMNNPKKNDYLFTGTITIKLFTDGEGAMNIYGSSFSRFRPEDSMKHLVYRDIFFRFTEPRYGPLLISDIRTVRHPLDDAPDYEASGLLFDFFDFESHKLAVRKISNGYVFGDQPVPSFICIGKN